MLRISLARLLLIVAVLAIYLALLEAAIKMTGLPGNYRFWFYTKELSRFGIYALWISVCFTVIANRNPKTAYTVAAMTAVAGFGATSLVDAYFQMWTLTTPAMGRQGAVYLYLGWGLVSPILETICWALLLYVFSKAWIAMAGNGTLENQSHQAAQVAGNHAMDAEPPTARS
jgi:hypothetical protein